MVKPNLRTKSVGTKVSEEEFARLEQAARKASKTLGEWCRDVMLVKYNCDGPVINIDCAHDLKAWANMLTVPEIKEFIDGLNQAVINLNRNANLHLLFQVLMLDMPRKEKRGEFAAAAPAKE